MRDQETRDLLAFVGFTPRWNKTLRYVPGGILHSMKTDKGQFDAVLSRMISTPPQKTAEIRAPKKAKAKRPKPNQK